MGMELPTVIATKGDGRRAMQWQRSGGGATEKHVVVQILRKIPSLRKTISVSLLWKNFSISLTEKLFHKRLMEIVFRNEGNFEKKITL